MHKVKILFLCCTILLPACGFARSDIFSLNIDLAKMAMLGTFEAEAGFNLSRHWNLKAGITFNPWTFRNDGKQFQHRQLFGSIGSRYWFWFADSGWFADAGGFYGIFNHGGIFNKTTYQGRAGGLMLSAGYALMLSKSINIDFDIGLKTGYASYSIYSCPACGEKSGDRKRFFISPDLGIGLTFIF